MKIRNFLALPLAAALMVPALAQTSSSSSDQTPSAATQSAQTPQDLPQTNTLTEQQAASDQNTTSRQPLAPPAKEGFWGHLNPFARKKYVSRQMEPIRGRVNELDELTASNSKMIKDVDSRATEGIRMASLKVNEADQHAIDAGNRAQAAHQTATQASSRLQTVEQVVTNIDQYQPINQTEIRFRSGQTALSTRAKQALDEIATSLKSQRGYIVEIQGFAPGSSSAAISSSQRMADSVVRYLVINHEIPVYRIYTLGMGNTKPATTDQASGKAPARGPRVEISVLKNNADQLSSQAQTNQDTMGNPTSPAMSQTQSQPR